MERRDLLGWIGAGVIGPVLAGLTPERLAAIGRALHGRMQAADGDARPLQVLDAHQNHTVITIAEHIIPETDTPGATAARVNAFIDRLLAEWYDEDDKDLFLRGLATVDLRCVDLFDTVFVHAEPDEQVAVLRGLDAELTAMREADLDTGAHFFARMKWLTVYGYYTSEVGQIAELSASIIPGRYDPCGPIERDTPGEW